jgi:hypothetical protein
MQNRIDRLEGLVLSLMTNGADSAGPAAAQHALGSGSLSSESQGYTHGDEMLKDEEEEEDGSETDRVTNSLGVLHVKEGGKSMYIGEAHWGAVLNDVSQGRCFGTGRVLISFQIAEVRNYYQEHKKQYEEQARKVEENKRERGFGLYHGPAFFFGGRNVPDINELLSALPGRDAVDKMAARFFNDYDIGLRKFLSAMRHPLPSTDRSQ